MLQLEILERLHCRRPVHHRRHRRPNYAMLHYMLARYSMVLLCLSVCRVSLACILRVATAMSAIMSQLIERAFAFESGEGKGEILGLYLGLYEFLHS